jgi:hypothetical protein
MRPPAFPSRGRRLRACVRSGRPAPGTPCARTALARDTRRPRPLQRELGALRLGIFLGAVGAHLHEVGERISRGAADRAWARPPGDPKPVRFGRRRLSAQNCRFGARTPPPPARAVPRSAAAGPGAGAGTEAVAAGAAGLPCRGALGSQSLWRLCSAASCSGVRSGPLVTKGTGTRVT